MCSSSRVARLRRRALRRRRCLRHAVACSCGRARTLRARCNRRSRNPRVSHRSCLPRSVAYRPCRRNPRRSLCRSARRRRGAAPDSVPPCTRWRCSRWPARTRLHRRMGVGSSRRSRCPSPRRPSCNCCMMQVALRAAPSCRCPRSSSVHAQHKNATMMDPPSLSFLPARWEEMRKERESFVWPCIMVAYEARDVPLRAGSMRRVARVTRDWGALERLVQEARCVRDRCGRRKAFRRWSARLCARQSSTRRKPCCSTKSRSQPVTCARPKITSAGPSLG